VSNILWYLIALVSIVGAHFSDTNTQLFYVGLAFFAISAGNINERLDKLIAQKDNHQ
jgi:hypothetical protein